jgi:glucoamylase
MQALDMLIDEQRRTSLKRLLENVWPGNALPGVVIASPSRDDPDYFYHWTRDAALVMQTLKRLADVSGSADERREYLRHLRDFAMLTRVHQCTASPGEPKFLVHGLPYTGPWGRPQNDGPALRALALMDYAEILREDDEAAFVEDVLYDPDPRRRTAIKTDLDFVADEWPKYDCDLWEEVHGCHFFTRMAQRRALVRGAALADRMGDPQCAGRYRQQAADLCNAIEKHWQADRSFITATLERQGGIDYKSGLDSSVLLAVLYTADDADRFFPLTDGRVLSTVLELKRGFRAIYDLNHVEQALAGVELGTAIGRYPEDRYDGYATTGEGDPWFLTTSAFAEFHYRLAHDLAEQKELRIGGPDQAWWQDLLGTDFPGAGATLCSGQPEFEHAIAAIRMEGDRHLARVLRHAADDGSMSEQFNRRTGLMQGAENLTWSHSAFLRAALAR